MNKLTNTFSFVLILSVIINLSGCENGYKLSQFVDDLIEKPSISPPKTSPPSTSPRIPSPNQPTLQGTSLDLKEAFSSIQKCFESHEDQYVISESVLANLVDAQCYDKENLSVTRELVSEITSLFTEIKKENAKIDQANPKPEAITEARTNLAALSDKYSDLQNMFAYCRTKQFVVEQPMSEYIDHEAKSGSLLLHAVGDVFGKNSGFEGNNSATTLGHRLFYLKQIKDQLAATQYIKDEAQAEPCKDIPNLGFTPKPSPHPDFSQSALDTFIKKHENAIKLSSAFQANEIEKLRQELIKQLNELKKKGDSVFLTASWEGHAFLYQFLKEEESGSFTLRIYNSGEGIGAYHAQSIKGFEIQYLPFAEVTGLSKEKLTSYVFLKSLAEIAIPEGYKTEPKDFYEKVLFELGGKPSKNVYEAKHFKAEQQAGTCSYFSQPWVIEASFDQMQENGIIEKESFFPTRLESLFGLKTLYDYGQKLKSEDEDLSKQNDEKLTLIEKSIVFLSSTLLNAAKDGALDPGFLNAAALIEEPLKDEVDRALAKSKAPIPNPIDISQPIGAEEKQALTNALIDDGIIPPDNPVNISRKIYMLDASNLTLKKNVDELRNQLVQLLAKIEGARANEQYVQIITFVQELALKLSLKADSFAGADSNTAEKIINLLSKIQTNYVFSLIKSIANGSRTAKALFTADFFTAVKLMSVADLLNENYVDLEKRLPSLYQPRFGELLFKDLAIIEAEGSRFEKQLHDLRQYYLNKKDTDVSFFQFELLPTGFYIEKGLKDRRVMYDPQAEIPDNKKHWSDGQKWNDVGWAVAWMKSRGGYAAWLAQEKVDSALQYSGKYIEPFTFAFNPAWGHQGGDGGDYFMFPVDKQPIPRIKDSIIDRRNAVWLLSQKQANLLDELSLPQVFFALRQMSYEVDFLLTGHLDRAWANTARYETIEIVTSSTQIDHEKPTGETKTFNSEKHDIVRNGYYDQYGQWVNSVWGWVPETVTAYYQKKTIFKGDNLRVRVFGQFVEQPELGPYNKELKTLDNKGLFVSPYVHLQNGILPFDKYAMKEKGVKFDIHGLMKIYSTGVDNTDPKLDPLVAQERKRLLPNDLIIYEPAENNLTKLTLERIRGVFTLSGIKKYQLVETLAIFSAYPSLLAREEYQRLFEKLMLEPRLILDELEVSEAESKQFVKKLTDFCRTQYNRFREIDNIKGMAFILQMNQLFKLQVKYAIKKPAQFKVTNDLADEFLNTAEELKANAFQIELSPAQQGFLWVTLANAFTYVKDFDVDDMASMLLAMCKYKTLGVPDKLWEDSYAQKKIENLLIEKQSQIQHALDGGDRNVILTRVAKNLRPDLDGNPEWNPKGGFLGPDERPAQYEAIFNETVIQLDVLAGLLYEDEQDQVPLPVVASLFEKALGSMKFPETVIRIGFQKYKWTEGGQEIRIEKSITGRTRFQKKIGPDWYQYMDDDELLGFLGNKGFKKGYDHWKEVAPAGLQQKILILDKKTKEQRYETIIAKGAQTLESITRSSDDARLAQLPNDHELVRNFSRIEDPNFIEFWIKDHDQIVEVALPRLKLSFKPIPATNKLDCGFLSKHRLADLQFTNTLKGPITYLICEPRDGEVAPRMALTALQRFIGGKTLTSLANDFAIDRDLANGEDGSQRLLTYELPSLNAEKTSEIGRSIVPTNNAAAYHLALRKWWTHDYQEARSLLLSSDAEISRLSKPQGEVSAIEWLMEGRPNVDKKEIQDVDPRATAVRLLASAILISQYQDYGLNPELSLKAEGISSLYESYLRNLSVLGNEWLNFYDEWTIASFISANNKSSPVIDNRIKVLKYLHPSRFEDDTPVKSFRTKVIATGGSREKLEKATFFDSDFDLENIIRDEGNPPRPPGFRSALNASDIFIPQNFGVLYDIAVGASFDRPSALAILQSILDGSADRDKLEINTLSDEDIRQEFAFLFRSSALYDKEKGETANDQSRRMARFLELASKTKNLPSWAMIKNNIAENKARLAEIVRINQEIHDKGWSKPLDDRRSSLYNAMYDVTQNVLTPVKNSDANTCFAPNISVQETPLKEPLKTKGFRSSPEDIVDLSQLLLRDPMKEPYLSDTKFDDFFETIPISREEVKKLEDASESLNAQLQRGMNGPINVKAALKKLQEKITQYTNKEIATSKNYQIKDWNKIKSLNAEIDNKQRKALSAMKEYHDEALGLVNGKKSLSQEASYVRVLRLAQADRTPKIDDLIYLLLTKKLGALQTVTLEEKDKKTLQHIAFNVIGYLLQSTYQHYLEECRKAVSELYSAKDEAANKIAPLAKKVATLIKEKRHYQYEDHIEFLIFEHFLELHIRKLQMAALEVLEIKDGVIQNAKALGAVLELIMGFGKTSVLLPLISALNTSGKWLNVIMLPEPLVASMSRELRQSMRKSFNRSVSVLEINRQTNLDENSLLLLYDRLVRARNEGTTIVTTNSSVQSLFLSYIDRLHRYDKDRNQVDKELTQFARIFRYLREYGLLTIDEVDMALDVLKSHQFSIGERIPIDETLTASVFSFYRLLTKDAEINQRISMPFLRNSRGDALTPEVYNEIKPAIIDKIVDKEDVFQGFSALNKAYRKFIKSYDNKTLLKNYWNNKNAANDRVNLFKAIDNNFKEPYAQTLKNMASVLYSEINEVFILTAPKKLNVHYGKLPEPQRGEDETDEQYTNRFKAYKNSHFIAIPYHAGQPAVNSRFGTPIEAVNYTIQKGIEERQFEEHVSLEVESLKAMGAKVTDNNSIESVKQGFERLINGYRAAPRSLGGITNAHIKDIANLLTNDNKLPLGLELMKSYTLPQLKTYEIQLYTNSQIYESLFRIVSGFSGTLWSASTFPKIFKEPEGSDTTEKTFMLLWLEHLKRKNYDPTHRSVREIEDPNVPDPNRYLDELLQKLYNNWATPGSLLDQAGMLRGFANTKVAENIGGKLARGMGVVNYDENDQIVDFENETGLLVPLSATAVPQNNRVAYWDKKHTTGSDLKLRPDMAARMTFDYHTFSRDLEQTVWRLRGLGQGQYIDEYLVLSGDLKLIKKKMTEILEIALGDLNDFDLGDLLLYVAVNQEMRLGDLLHRSLKQKMSNVVSLEALNQMLDKNTTNEKAASIYKSFAKLFERKLDQQPYNYLGLPATTAATDDVLERDQNKIFDGSIKMALKNILSSISDVVTIIKNRIDYLIKSVRNLLPAFLKTSEIETGLEVEIEMEQEQEQEQEQETEREIEQFQFDRKYKPHKVLDWPKANIFSDNYFKPANLADIGPKLNADLSANNVAPMFSIKEALKKGGQSYDILADFIDENLFGSLNFAPFHHRNIDTQEAHYEFNFFSLYQKASSNVLVILNGNKNDKEADVKLVVLDNNDVQQFDQMLRDDLNNPGIIIGKDNKVALYNIEQGIFRQGDSRIDADALEKNENFIALITQLKFLNGDLFYSNKQKDYLKDFIEKSDIYMFRLFKDVILRYKQDSREQMSNSHIGKLFDDLGLL